MIIKSFSKINLSLRVNKKIKKSKLHDIQTFFCLINLFDEIKINKIKGEKDIVKFQGRFAKYIKKTRNSIIDALKVLRERNLIFNHYSVLVNKKIPVFAGMGGGTSNAIYLIKHLTKKKVNKDLFNILNKKIGSDFKLFFYDQGFLKNLKSINSFQRKHRLYFLLIYPNVKCSTRYVYSKVNQYSSKLRYSLKKINDKRNFIDLLINEDNDLQSIVEKKYPIVEKIIKEIGEKKGCYFSRMTGSGSVCYGVFKSEKTAKAALNRMRSKYPRYWITVAKTI